MRICSDGRVSLFYAHDDEEEAKWELTSRSSVTIPPGADTIGRIVNNELNNVVKVEFLEKTGDDGMKNDKVLSLTIKPFISERMLAQYRRKWTENLT